MNVNETVISKNQLECLDMYKKIADYISEQYPVNRDKLMLLLEKHGVNDVFLHFEELDIPKKDRERLNDIWYLSLLINSIDMEENRNDRI